MARAHSGCEVWQQNLLALALPAARFDGIFANAVLQHVPASELPRVLGELRAALRPGGVLFSSIPRGHGEEGWNNGRYSVYHEPATWRRHGADAGFVELEHYYRPEGRPRAAAAVAGERLAARRRSAAAAELAQGALMRVTPPRVST